jgi:hypothetical protein
MLFPAIYFCAHRCRDWHTRRETLRLISGSRRREGFWTSGRASAVLQLFINEESVGLMPGDVVPMHARIDMVHFSSSPTNLKGVLWYHRPSSPEEIDNGADVHGIWKSVSQDFVTRFELLR